MLPTNTVFPMFFADSFLFLHLPKTGGWTTRGILTDAGLATVKPHLSQHSARHQIPLELRKGKQILTNIREPCAWYRSYFHYNIRTDGTMSPFIARLLNGKPFEFKRALEALLFDVPQPEVPMQMLGIEQRISPRLLTERGIGPYSWMVHHQLSERPSAERIDEGIWLIDTAQLREGLEQAMQRLGVSVQTSCDRVADDNCNVDLVAQGKRLLPYSAALQDDFDKEMVEWVEIKERKIIDLMGFRGPNSRARQSVVSS